MLKALISLGITINLSLYAAFGSSSGSGPQRHSLANYGFNWCSFHTYVNQHVKQLSPSNACFPVTMEHSSPHTIAAQSSKQLELGELS